MANGLITLQTDLKSLRYGSEKPYVTKNIGQAPGSQIGVEVQSRVDDVSRIAQMFASKPGLKYLLHEAELRQVQIGQIAKKAEQGNKSVAGAILSKIGNELLSTVKLVGSTVGQVAVDGTGTHFLKGFRTDTYLRPASDPNNPDGPSPFARFFGAGGVEGAPLALKGETIPVDPNVNVTTALTPEKADKSPYSPKNNDAVGTVYSSGKEKSVLKPFGIDSTEDTYTDKNLDRQSLNGPVIKETRINLGDQGARNDSNKKQNIYWKTSADKSEIDKINSQKIVEEIVTGETKGRDLIKFRFHVITPDTTRILYFRAFLDSFADNYSGQWNPIKYLGRAEDFQIYSGFQRKITLSFKIAAATRSEMQPLYRKMVYLASATAPTYADSGQFMRGTIVKLTLGDYVYELPGVLNSCNFTWNTEYPWEIALTEPEKGGDQTMQELPMVLDCSIDFTPIHTFTPETGLKKYFTSGLETSTAEQGERFFEDTAFGAVDAIQQEELTKKERAQRDAEKKAQAEADAKITQLKEVEIVGKRPFGPLTEKRAARDAMKATSSPGTANITKTPWLNAYDPTNTATTPPAAFEIVPDYLSQPYGS
jgi:hypothetical protein